MENASNVEKAAPRRRETYHHGDLRGALTEALRVLIERDGPDGFRIAEACRMAGVSTAAPYKHFRDRDAMLRAVALGGMARLGEAMQAAAGAHAPRDPERIVALGRSYLDFARAEPGVFRLMFGLAEHHDDDPRLKASGEAAKALVDGVVADHLGLAPDVPEVHLRAHALWCFVHGLSFLSLDGKIAEEGPDFEDEMLRFTGAAVLPAPPEGDARGARAPG